MRQLLVAIALFVASAGTLRAQTFADRYVASGNCEPIVAVTCPSGVENPEYAVDNNPDNYALLKTNLGLSILESTAFEEVGFTKLGAPGSEIGLIVEFVDQGLGPQVMNNLTVVVYDSLGNEVLRRSDLSLTDVSALSGASNRRIIRVATPIADYKIGKVRLEITSLVNANQMLAFYGAYHNATCPAVLAESFVDVRNFRNPEFVVDQDTGTYGILSVPLSLLDSGYITLGFAHPAMGGDFIGFEIAKNQSVLQLGVLDSLSIILYNANGGELGRKNDFTTADLFAVNMLSETVGGLIGMSGADNERYIIGFNSSSTITEPIAYVKLMLKSTIGLLLETRVHAGFYYSGVRGVRVTADRSGIIGGQPVHLTAQSGFSNYSWSNGAVGQTIAVTTPGVYTVTVGRFDGCLQQGAYEVKALDCNAGGRVFADSLVAFGNCDPQVLLVCPSGVDNPGNAVDADLSNYATMSSSLGVSIIESTSFLDMAFTTPGQAGNKIGILMQAINQNLNADVVDNLTIYLFDTNGDTIKSYSGTNLSNVGLLSGTGGLAAIELSTPVGNYQIGRIQLSLEGVANVLQDLAIYGVYYDCACPAIMATSVDSAVNVLSPEFAVDADQSNYAELGTLIGTGNQAVLKLNFDNNVAAGDYVGFQLEFGNTLLAANVIGNITVNVYDQNDSMVTTYSDFRLADLVAADQLGGTLGSLLGTGEAGSSPFVLGFTTPAGSYIAKSIEIILEGTLGVAQNLRVYNGFAISQLQGVAISSSDSIICKGASVTLTAPAGYTSYLWSTGATTQSITVSSAGFYSVTIGRADGCNLSGSYFVRSRDYGFNFTTTQSDCQLATGSATVSVTGGSGNYSYQWSTGDTTVTADSLASGRYFVVVTDNILGCRDTGYVNVSDSTFEFTGYVRHATCGQNNGAIFLTVPDGYTILWEDGSTAEVRNNLAPGDYTVTVTNPDGCKNIITYTVLSKADFGLSATVTPAACLLSTGSVNLSVSVAGNYSFKWSNGATTEDIMNLPAGAYTVVVTDLNTGCEDILTAIVSDLLGPIVNLVEAKEEVCARDENGRIEIAVTNLLPYTADWNNGVFGLVNENLGPGIYVVRVSDNTTGCTTVGVYELVARDAMQLAVNGTPSVCTPPFNGSVMTNVSGGRTPYTYLYNTGDTTANVSGVAPGNYTVQVTDFNGCAVDGTTTVGRHSSCDEDTTGGGGKRGEATELVTPNFDGYNDFFFMTLDDDYPQNKLEIFDRDGVMVFEGNNYKSDWAGTYRKTSSRLPDGTYFWVFRPKNTKKEFRGFFVLKN